MKVKSLLIFILIILTLTTSAQGVIENIKSKPRELPTLPDNSHKKRKSQYLYTYVDRSHTMEEDINNIAGIYAFTWVVYPLTQLDTVKNTGSVDNYKRNFGNLVFDKDEPFWNWFVHPISGSQLFLFYRARGYSRPNALAMSFLSSALFEFTVEIYTEPASVQDLYQTPVLGSVLGLGIEKLSLYLLNTGNLLGKILGHAMNPSTLFWFYEGKIKVTPQFYGKNKAGLNVTIDW